MGGKNRPCGITGWYAFDKTKNDAFVGWLEVLPEYRKKSIASKSMEFIIEDVKKQGFKNLRVYTDRVVNHESTFLYNKYFDICEDYTYPDKIGKTNNFVVFSKLFTKEKLKWNNYPLGEDDNYEL